MFNETVVYGNQLQTDTGEPRQSIPYTFLGHYYEEYDRPNYLYDAIAYDADIELDSIKNDPDVINGLEITVFAKLPKINIGTPYGTYNPDLRTWCAASMTRYSSWWRPRAMTSTQ